MTIPLFDVQAGFGGTRPGVREIFSASALREEMDRLQIEKALVRLVPDEMDMDVAGSNAILYDAFDSSGGRLVPCPVITPSCGGDCEEEEVQVEHAIARGAGAVVLRPGKDYWSVEEWFGGRLLACLEERGLPALCPQKTVPPADVARVAKAHARLPIIMIEANYRTHRPVCALLAAFPNVHLSIGANYAVHGAIEDLVERFGPQRLLFGTGIPTAEPMMGVTHLLYAGISEPHKRMIGWENLHRLIGGIRK